MKNHVCFLLLLFLAGLLAACAQQQATTQPEATTPPNDPTALAQEFVDLLAQKEFDMAVDNLDTAMTDTFPPDKLQETWEALTAQVGPFKRQVDTRTEKQAQYNVVFVTCEFEQTMLDVKVVFDEAGQIAGMFFIPPESQE